MGRRLNVLIKRFVSLMLTLIMVVGMIPIKTEAMTADYTGRLVDTSISLSIFPVHYIVYEYGGTISDSRDATVGQNYKAWCNMSDADRSKVTKWFAGFSSQLKTQFGENNYKKMLKWANEHNGWEQAGNVLRNRLANKNYEELYNYYGEPDNPNPVPKIEVDFDALSEYSEKEKIELSSKINDYQVAYEEGLDSYQRLIKLKQQQTNVAVTAISSELIQIIVDNMIGCKPLSPGGSLDDLKDAAVDFADKTFEISDTFKKTGLYKYTQSGIRDSLTGEDQRIDSKEAARVVAMFWKLLNAREDYAYAGYLTCTRLYEDIEKEYGDLVKLDKRRVSDAEASKKAIEEAHKLAVEEGVAFLSELKPSINVDPADYYTTDGNGNRVLDTDAYNKARNQAAKTWARTQFYDGTYRQTYNSFVTDMKDFFASGKGHVYCYVPNSTLKPVEPVYTYMDNGKLVEERPEELYYRIFRKYLRPLEREDQHPMQTTVIHNLDGTTTFDEHEMHSYYVHQSAKQLFRTYDNYKSASAAVEKAYDESLRCLNEIRSQYVAALEASKPYFKSFITDTQPARNNMYTLCYGVNKDYGAYSDWGIGEEYWNYFKTEYDRDLEKIENNIDNLVKMVDIIDAEIDRVEQIQSNFKAEKAALEESLPDTYRIYEQTQKDMEYGVDQYVKGIEGLKDFWDKLPAWVNDVNNRRVGTTLITNQTLYKESFSGLEKGGLEYMSKIDEILRNFADVPDEEASYIDQITYTEALWRNSCVKLNNMGVYGETALENLSSFCEGIELKTPEKLADDYNADEYDHFFKYEMREKCGELRNLIKDLKGESVSLEKMKDLYYESLAKRGDWLRAAKMGERTEEFNKYCNEVGYPAASNNAGVYSCRRQAEGCSYTSWVVEDYYEEFVEPIYAGVDSVWYGEATYKEVEAVKKATGNGFDFNRNSVNNNYNSTDGNYSDISEDSIKLYEDPEDEQNDDGTNISLALDDEKKLEVVVVPEDATYPELVWESSDSEVASVDGDGIVKAIAPGTTTIKATALDSPSESPIYIEFIITVTAPENYKSSDEAVDEMKTEGISFSLINPSLKLSNKNVAFGGTLVYAGDTYYPPVDVICAIYDGDRFVGSSLVDEELVSGEGVKVSANISLIGPVVDGLSAKLYLVNDTTFVPIENYTPIEIEGNEIDTEAAAVDENVGIYKVNVATSSDENDTEVINTKITDKISLSVLNEKGDVVTPDEKIIDDKTYNDYYESGRKIRLDYSGAVKDSDYMVVVLTERKTPTLGNIAYVYQKKADGTNVTFDIYTSSIKNADYTIYLVGDGNSEIKTISRVADYSGVNIDEMQSAEEETIYTITYNLDGGVVSVDNPDTYTNDTEDFTLNNPTKDGYEFLGWTGSNGDSPQITVTVGKGTTGDLNYQANWAVNEESEEEGGEGETGEETGGSGEDASGNGNESGESGEDAGGNGNESGGSKNEDTGNDSQQEVTPSTSQDSGNNDDDKTSTPGSDGNGNNDKTPIAGRDGNNNDGKTTASAGNTSGTDTTTTGSTEETLFTQTVKDGDSVSEAGSTERYIVLSATDKTVAITGDTSRGAKITLKSEIKDAGVTYTVTAISDGAFKKSKITAISIPVTIESIGSSAFEGCAKLKTVTIKGNKLSIIGDGAFKNCSSLTKITIPKSVKKVGKNAFANCKKLKTITVKNKKIKFAKNSLKGVPKTATIKFPKMTAKEKKAFKKMLKSAGFKGKVK